MPLFLSQSMTSSITCFRMAHWLTNDICHVAWKHRTREDCCTAPCMQDMSLAGSRRGKKSKSESPGIFHCDSPVFIHLCYTPSDSSSPINQEILDNRLRLITLIHFFWIKVELQNTLNRMFTPPFKGREDGTWLNAYC